MLKFLEAVLYCWMWAPLAFFGPFSGLQSVEFQVLHTKSGLYSSFWHNETKDFLSISLFPVLRIWFFVFCQIAAALMLGASGVVLGTRLAATNESIYGEAKKKAMVDARSDACTTAAATFMRREGQ